MAEINNTTCNAVALYLEPKAPTWMRPKKNKTTRVTKAPKISGKVALLAPVSKNYVRGYLITRPEEIYELACQGKSLYNTFYGVGPAAFYNNWQLGQIVKMVKNETFYHITTND